MMHQTDTFSYYADDNLQAVQLPYAYAASMYIVLPEEGCNPVDFLSHIPEMESRKVALSLPKFQTESKFDLVPLLENMGVTSAFNFETADFSNTLNKSKDELPYRLDKVLQKTYIDLDESGTTATAATVITGVGGASPEDPVDFTADRPFTYFICDNATNEVLFMGEYAYAECV